MNKSFERNKVIVTGIEAVMSNSMRDNVDVSFSAHKHSLAGVMGSNWHIQVRIPLQISKLLAVRHRARFSRSCDCISQAHKFAFMQPFVVATARVEMKMSRTKRKRQSVEASYQLRNKIETLKIRFECRE